MLFNRINHHKTTFTTHLPLISTTHFIWMCWCRYSSNQMCMCLPPLRKYIFIDTECLSDNVIEKIEKFIYSNHFQPLFTKIDTQIWFDLKVTNSESTVVLFHTKFVFSSKVFYNRKQATFFHFHCNFSKRISLKKIW